MVVLILPNKSVSFLHKFDQIRILQNDVWIEYSFALPINQIKFWRLSLQSWIGGGGKRLDFFLCYKTVQCKQIHVFVSWGPRMVCACLFSDVTNSACHRRRKD